MLKKHAYKIALVGIFVLGVALRLIDLGSADLWRDEAFTIRAAAQSFSGMIDAIGNDTAPPLHTIVVHYWANIFGWGEFSVRFPSFIAGVVTLVFAFLLTKKMFKSKNAILLSNFLLSTSPVLVWYSQEARAYSLFIMMTTMSLYYAIKVREQKIADYKDLALLSISTIIGLYTHNLFMFVAFVNFLLVISKYRKPQLEIAKFIASQAIAGILFLPWFFITLKQIDKVKDGGFWLSFHPIKNVIGTIVMFFTAENYPDQVSRLVGILLYLVWIISVPLFLFSIGFAFRKSTAKNVKILMAWFWGLMFICWAYSFSTPVFYIRYLTFLVPAVLIILTFTLFKINQKSKILFGFFALVFMIVPLLLDIVVIDRQPDTKEQMSSLVRDIHYDPQGDIILHTNAYSQHAFVYYSDLDNKIYNPDNHIPYFEGLSVIHESDYYRKQEITGYKRVWVIYMLGQKKPITEELKKNYKLTEIKNYPGKTHLELWVANK